MNGLKPDVSVDLIAGGDEYPLEVGSNAHEIPEQRLTIRVSASEKIDARFDDKPAPLIWSRDEKVAFLHVDLHDQAGFHRLALGRGPACCCYDFATTSAKATHAEIESMAKFVSSQAFAFRKQFHYSIPTGERRTVRLPQVEFGWLRERIPELSNLIRSISERPGSIVRRQLTTSFEGRGLDLSRTSAFLRENPQLLEESDGGYVSISGRSYSPVAVRCRKRVRQTTVMEHRQLAAFLEGLTRSCDGLVSEAAVSGREEVLAWRADLMDLRSLPLFSGMARAGPVARIGNPAPTQLERSDTRYARLRVLQAEYQSELAPRAAAEAAVRTNVRDAWDIYEAFVAHVVGLAFNLVPVSKAGDLRERDGRSRSMVGTRMSLYYDVHPPADLLPSWRDGTTRPAFERPDVVLVNEEKGEVAILDAKFRTDRDPSRAHPSDLQEMQGYMQSFRVDRGGIAYPGRGEGLTIQGRDSLLAEIPISPGGVAPEALFDNVRKAVEELWAPIP